MKEKDLGTLLIILGVSLAVVSAVVKIVLDVLYEQSSYMIYFYIWAFCGVMVALGTLLRRADELDEHLKESQLRIDREHLDARAREREKRTFAEFLKGFSADEQEVISLLHSYEGITEAGLMKKVTVGKEKLHRVIRRLEKAKVLREMDNKLYLLKMGK